MVTISPGRAVSVLFLSYRTFGFTVEGLCDFLGAVLDKRLFNRMHIYLYQVL